MITASYHVTGMTCDHCVNAVRSEVSAVANVTDVQVDLTSGSLVVQSSTPIELTDIETAVDEAGYTVAPA